MTTAIWWIRRDLRLSDNQALHAAMQQADEVAPVFVLDPALLQSPTASERRTAFLFGGLRKLADALRRRGSRLIVRSGNPAHEIARLAAECSAIAVCAECDSSPYARRRDGETAAALERTPLQLTGGLTARPLAPVVKVDGTGYTVFTPFSRKWKSFGPLRQTELLEAPAAISSPQELESLPIPDAPVRSAGSPFAPGEDEAARRLAAFVEGDPAPIYSYSELRNRPDLDGTSALSPYLRFGMLSPRAAAAAAYAAMESAPEAAGRASAELWLNELIWREFYISILAAFPHVRRGSFRSEYDAIAWDNDEQAFTAWCAGQTGYPLIDAAMRQLRTSGWMHNRARMAVASFLVKDLLIDWRWGERWFMQQLVDGDPAANNGGWQWTAGVGTDAAPYFRIFNPISQGQKFDPDGLFVRRWLPELAAVPTQFVHEPWKMPAELQVRTDCIIGQDYPQPIIDHAWARDRVLEAFKAAKGE